MALFIQTKLKVTKPKYAVDSGYGPVFGSVGVVYNDLFVNNLSNTNRGNYMDLNAYEFPEGKSGEEGGEFIVGGEDCYFQTDDIEVFEVV